jgi:hypothetical protein
MLAGTARALANSMAGYAEEFPDRIVGSLASEQLFLHTLAKPPLIDGYVDDWLLSPASLRSIRGPDGAIRMALASYGRMVYLYIDVRDRNVVYATADTLVLDDGPRYADRVTFVSSSPPYLEEQFIFAAEAPGPIVSYKQDDYGFAPESAITAHWQDVPATVWKLEYLWTCLAIISVSSLAIPKARIKSRFVSEVSQEEHRCPQSGPQRNCSRSQRACCSLACV